MVICFWVAISLVGTCFGSRPLSVIPSLRPVLVMLSNAYGVYVCTLSCCCKLLYCSQLPRSRFGQKAKGLRAISRQSAPGRVVCCSSHDGRVCVCVCVVGRGSTPIFSIWHKNNQPTFRLALNQERRASESLGKMTLPVTSRTCFAFCLLLSRSRPLSGICGGWGEGADQTTEQPIMVQLCSAA